MAMKLSTALSHITTVPNSVNSKIITEFYQYMKDTGTSENYQNQNLKAIIIYIILYAYDRSRNSGGICDKVEILPPLLKIPPPFSS
jgi:hypothetical protein